MCGETVGVKLDLGMICSEVGVGGCCFIMNGKLNTSVSAERNTWSVEVE